MGRRVMWGAMAFVLVAFGGSVADAKHRPKAKKHAFTITDVSATVSQVGTPPAAGATATTAGVVTSSLGNGAVVGHLTFTGGFGFKATNTFFTGSGTVSGQATGTGALQPDGSLKFTGTETITGGTGRVKGAKGSATFTGTEPAPGKPTTFHFKGTISY